jgi:hypothetical protein
MVAVRYQRDALTTPRGLLSALQDLFPDFGDEELSQDIETGEASLHAVIAEFRGFFSSAASTDRQLTSLSTLIAECVRTPDLLENAVGTCLLEALERNDRLWKFLSPEVKAYARAY